MHPFWDAILRPLLQAVRPATIVEIGVEQGRTTEQLLRFCTETGATLHGIDPHPLMDAAEWNERWGDTWTLHRGRSLDVLPTLPPFDAILIDGDHNWYTVYHELQAIHRHAREHARQPIIFLHDIAAPYGRRDQYCDPEAIPAAHRHPWKRQGIDVERRALVEEGGLNPGASHAVDEGTPHNGVRTAVEDALREAPGYYAFHAIPGFHGLGILAPHTLLDQNPSLQRLMNDLSPSALLQAHMEQLEHDRLLRIPLANELDRALRGRQALREECGKLAGTIEQLLIEKQQWKKEHALHVRSVHAFYRAEIAHIHATRSWRWTAWMRRAGGWMRRRAM